MSRSRLLLAAVVGLLALSACSSGSSPRSATSGTTSKTWTLTYAGTTTPIRLATQAQGSDLRGTRLLIEYSDRVRGELNRVGTVDLSTGTRTELARLSYPGGQMIGTVGTGDWVVYGEESARGRYTPGTALWRIVALGPRGQHQVLATSGGRRVTTGPDLTTVDGVAQWTLFPSLRTYAWKPGQTSPRREEVAPGDANECTPNATSAELVTGCTSTADWIAWTEKANPATETAENDDPAHLFFAPTTSGSPQKLADLDAVNTPPQILGDYLLWDSGHGLEVTSLEHPSAQADLGPGAMSVQIVAGDRSAVVIRQQARRTTAQVVTLDDLRLSSG